MNWLKLSAVIGGLVLAVPLGVQAAEYPTRPIRLVVPYAAGGPTDLPARIASQIILAKLGQPIVVENRPGAGGTIGARAGAWSATISAAI